MNVSDYYNILGVAKTASVLEIKRAYRKLVLIYHPDKNNGSKIHEKKITEINEAYSVLSNHSKRILYDYSLIEEKKPSVERSKYDKYYDAYIKKYEHRTKHDVKDSPINPYLLVFGFFGFAFILALLLTPKEDDLKNEDTFTYTITDSAGNLIFETNSADDATEYLHKKYKNSAVIKPLVDSILINQK